MSLCIKTRREKGNSLEFPGISGNFGEFQSLFWDVGIPLHYPLEANLKQYIINWNQAINRKGLERGVAFSNAYRQGCSIV